TITVLDNTPPTISGQGNNTTIYCPSTPSFTPPTASDACGNSTVHELSDQTVAGSCANSYTRTKKWDATDACGNHSATVSQTITPSSVRRLHHLHHLLQVMRVAAQPFMHSAIRL